MKVLIVYDSVPPSKVTMKVAQTIQSTLRERALDAECLFYKDVDMDKVKGCDCLIVGAPTMAFRPSKGISEFLNALSGEELRGKLGAAFDTQIKSPLSGNAAKGIEKRLADMRLSVFKPHLVAFVEGKGKNTWELREGEIDKVISWAKEAADNLAKGGGA